MNGALQGIADWRLTELLGQGECASVYRATRASEGADAIVRAAKVLDAALAQDSASVLAFEARVAVARRLAGGPLVAVVDAGRADGRPFAVFEHVDGVALERLAPEPAPGRRAKHLHPTAGAHVLREVLGGLARAQAIDPHVVHGLLDAGDILVDSEGEVRLTGFGLRGDARADLLAVGTLAHRLVKAWPPEVEAWIDELRRDDSSLSDAAAARSAFPLGAFEPGALEQGRKKLGRAVRRSQDAARREREAERPSAPFLDREEAETELAPALAQAEGVLWVCGAVLVVALLLEILSH